MQDQESTITDCFIPDISDEDRSWIYHHECGREFRIHEIKPDRFTLSEMVPNGKYWENGEVQSPDVLARIVKSSLPNQVCEEVREHGFDPQSLIRIQTPGTRFPKVYPTLKSCADAILSAIAENRIYDPVDHDKANDPQEIARHQQVLDQEMENWKRYKSEMRRGAEIANAGLFKGLYNAFGPIGEAAQKEILSYLNAPSQDKWERIYPIMISMGRPSTLWQAWVAVDPDAPKSKPLDGGWPCIPSPEMLIKALDYVRSSD